MSGGWGLAFTPEENRPAQSLAVSRAWRPVTRGGYVDLGAFLQGDIVGGWFGRKAC